MSLWAAHLAASQKQEWTLCWNARAIYPVPRRSGGAVVDEPFFAPAARRRQPHDGQAIEHLSRPFRWNARVAAWLRHAPHIAGSMLRSYQPGEGPSRTGGRHAPRAIDSGDSRRKRLLPRARGQRDPAPWPDLHVFNCAAIAAREHRIPGSNAPLIVENCCRSIATGEALRGAGSPARTAIWASTAPASVGADRSCSHSRAIIKTCRATRSASFARNLPANASRPM